MRSVLNKLLQTACGCTDTDDIRIDCAYTILVLALMCYLRAPTVCHFRIYTCVWCSPLAVCKFLPQTAQKAKNPAELLLCTIAACLAQPARGVQTLMLS